MRYRAKPSGHHYELQIGGAGDPLLLLHGFSGDHSSWQAVEQELNDRFQLISLDILGHGASDKPADAASYRMDRVAADIIDLLDQLKMTQAHLLGYSMGGRLALFLALRHAERFRSLILESASPGIKDERERRDRQQRDNDLADTIDARKIKSFVDDWEALPMWQSQSALTPAVRKAQRDQRLRNDPQGLANSLRGMGSGAQPSLWSGLPTLDLPTQLIVGELDLKFRRINQEMAKLIPRAALSVIPAAGHNTHLEQTAAFCHAVQSFLGRV